jgi:Divergent InlB B-repeat domain/PKD domain
MDFWQGRQDDRRARGGLRAGVGIVTVVAALALGAAPAGAILYHVHGGHYVSYEKIQGKPAPSNVTPPNSLEAPIGREIFNGPNGYMAYSGGPVMPSSTNYVFQWVGSNYTGPAFGSGGGCGPDAHAVSCSSIPNGVNTFFQDLHTASVANAANMDQVATQYVANGGAPNFNVSAGAMITDNDPYPTNGCPSSPAVAGGRCVTDAQIQAELQSYLSSHGLPNGLTNEYYVVMPQGVASCFDAAGQQCSGNASAHPVFCAYHGRTATSGQYVYSNIPDVSDISGCDPFASTSPGGDGTCSFFTCIWPNGYGDGVMSAVSHEHNESITDPEPNNAWADWGQVHNKPGEENGDKCNFDGLDDPSVDEHDNGDFTFTPTNQTVGSHRYLIQMEFSNQGVNTAPCVNHYTPTGTAPPASFTSSASGLSVTFTAAGGAAQYVWQFNDDVVPGDTPQQFTQTTTSPTIMHAFPQAGTYTVALTAMASDGRTVAVSHDVTVTNPPPQQTLTVSRGGSGSGTVTSTDAQINCGATCSHAYDQGTLVTLNANPDSGSSFAGWSGGGCSGTGSCQVTMSTAQSVTATFTGQGGGPSNNFSFGKAKLNKKKGTAKLPVTVPNAGNLTLSGKGLTPIHKAKAGKAVRAGTTKLLVKAKGKAAKKLKRKGKLKVTAKVRFTPTGGTPNTESKTIKLVRKR